MPLAETLSVAGICIGVARIIQNYIYKKDDNVMNALADNPDIDLVAVREQLLYLRDTLNAELPKIQPESDNLSEMSICEEVIDNRYWYSVLDSEMDRNSEKAFNDLIQLLNNNDEYIRIRDELINFSYPPSEINKEITIELIEKFIGEFIRNIVIIIVRDNRCILRTYSDIETSEAIATLLDGRFKESSLSCIVDKKFFKTVAYTTLVFMRHLIREGGDYRV